jgi:hypothetical protein
MYVQIRNTERVPRYNYPVYPVRRRGTRSFTQTSDLMQGFPNVSASQCPRRPLVGDGRGGLGDPQRGAAPEACGSIGHLYDMQQKFGEFEDG